MDGATVEAGGPLVVGAAAIVVVVSVVSLGVLANAGRAVVLGCNSW